MNARNEELQLDKRSRNRLEDQRRMAYRRAIEERVEMRRAELELDANFGHLGGSSLSLGLGRFR